MKKMILVLLLILVAFLLIFSGFGHSQGYFMSVSASDSNTANSTFDVGYFIVHKDGFYIEDGEYAELVKEFALTSSDSLVNAIQDNRIGDVYLTGSGAEFIFNPNNSFTFVFRTADGAYGLISDELPRHVEGDARRISQSIPLSDPTQDGFVEFPGREFEFTLEAVSAVQRHHATEKLR